MLPSYIFLRPFYFLEEHLISKWVCAVDHSLKKIVFVEIKAGVSMLSTRERIVRDAVIAGRIEWMDVKANLDGADFGLSSYPPCLFIRLRQLSRLCIRGNNGTPKNNLWT